MPREIIPVILAGGSGTRLWPLSRKLHPKQLLALAGPQTMIQATLNRLQGPTATVLPPLIICNSDHRFMVAEQLREANIADATILLEPMGRNTAPAVAVAALEALTRHEDPILLVLPADHVIRNPESFLEATQGGADLAADNHLITFGIVPNDPETGFGYIEKGSPVSGETINTGLEAFEVKRFVEKPDQETAKSYLASGDFFWNSGMFMFRASRFLEELEKFAPEMYKNCKAAHEGRTTDLDFVRLDEEAFAQCPSDSIDYAIMEKTKAAVTIPLDCGWSDVGSWSALWEIGDQDDDGNILHGNVLTHKVSNSYLHSTHRMVAAVGLDNHVVVETADAILVAHKDQVQDVKKIVEQLKADNREEAISHRRVYRPWGSYECIDCAERFQVKRIIVKPGATLSLQMHYHRAEHWIVVQGTARITNGDDIIVLSENQSTYIPLGAKHRLENPGTIPLELIEVQSGSYLGEDDIIRLDDVYGRSEENKE